jgi:Carboxypeptidase regulatory-like domain
MRPRALSVGSLLLAFLASQVAAVTRTGRVVEDHSGNPVSLAEIQLARDGASQLIADLETDSSGQFALPNLTSGTYRLDVSKPGYVKTTMRLQVSADEQGPLLIRLVRCGVISGRVLDGQGEPLLSATVYAINVDQDGTLRRPTTDLSPANMTRVDPNGAYRLYDLKPGKYLVAITYGASSAMAGMTGSSTASTAGSGFILLPSNNEPRMFTISGGEEYKDNDYSVTPGQLVRLSGYIETAGKRSRFLVAVTSPVQPLFATAVAYADETGHFQLGGIPAGNYLLLVSGPSEGRGPLGSILHDDALFGRMKLDLTSDVEDVAVPVAPGRAASFVLRHATSADHKCSSGVQLRISSKEDWGADLNFTLQVTEGKPATLAHLAPAPYFVTVDAADGNCAASAERVVDLTEAVKSSAVPITVAAKE